MVLIFQQNEYAVYKTPGANSKDVSRLKATGVLRHFNDICLI